MTVARIAQVFRNQRTHKNVIKGFTALSTLGFTLYYWPEIESIGLGIKRASRTVAAVSVISWDYKRNFPTYEDKLSMGEDKWVELRTKVHQGAAKRLLNLFRANGGIYIKVGQHLSALEHIVPTHFCRELSVLHNQAPPSSMIDVETVIAEDLGRPLDKVFSSFDINPIGVASLAQVHKATLSDTGQEVAVKVQHLRLQSFVDSDMFVISMAVRAVKFAFPDFDLDWVADEMRTNLPLELDFVHEALNSERITRNLKNSKRMSLSEVKVPKIYWEQTRRRVLTMEYCEGAKATDCNFLDEHCIDKRQVATRITKLFSEMIFINGFVHCDPHPGNLLVRPKSMNSNFLSQFIPWRMNTPFELVLLDHGLYRELPEDFRLDYAHLWKALIDADESNLAKYANRIGGGEAYRLVSCILTQRTWQSIAGGSISLPRTDEEAAAIRSRAPQYLSQVTDLLARLPRPLLLLLKTNDLLRHLERTLIGDSNAPSRTFIIMAQYCLDAVHEGPSTLPENFRYFFDKAKIALLDWYMFLSYQIQKIYH